jgi:YD repeat-containing protein
VERLTFNSQHYVLSETEAYGTPLARTTSTTRQAGSNLVTAVVDGLSRRTEYAYKATGQILTVARLAGTSDAATTTFSYEPQFKHLATITHPLQHTWTLAYDAFGKIASITDPLTHQAIIATNAAGQVTTVTDPLQHTWQWGYSSGDSSRCTRTRPGLGPSSLRAGRPASVGSRRPPCDSAPSQLKPRVGLDRTNDRNR